MSNSAPPPEPSSKSGLQFRQIYGIGKKERKVDHGDLIRVTRCFCQSLDERLIRFETFCG
eukprot:CCRYP_015512-RA/>CCRYP_015512-RA protein AED:0.44 eAED:0.62 QI:123/0/0.5/1/1/1/2/0/59